MKVFESRDVLLFPLLVFSILLGSYLLGGIMPFFIAIGVLLIFSVIGLTISVIRRGNSSFSEFLGSIKETIYISVISGVIGMLPLVVIPYLFPDKFLGIFAFQLAYVFPSLLVYFIALNLISHLIKERKPEFLGSLKSAIISSMMFFILTALVLLVGINFLYRFGDEQYNTFYPKAIEMFEKESSDDSGVFSELEEYRASKLGQAEATHESLGTMNTHFCITTDCVRLLVDKSYSVADAFGSAAMYQASVTAGKNFDERLKGAQITDEALRKYREDIQPANDSYAKVLEFADSDFIPSQLKSMENYALSNDNLIPIAHFSENPSPMEKSARIALDHSIMKKEISRMAIKLKVLQDGKKYELYNSLHKNSDVNESSKSKAIRYQLLIFLQQMRLGQDDERVNL